MGANSRFGAYSNKYGFQYFVILPTCRNVNVDTDKAFLFVGCCSFFLGTKSLQVVETNGENRRPRYGAC